MATAGKGLPFIGKMNEFLDKMLHPTVQKVGHSRAAIDVIHRGYYSLNPVPTTPYIMEAGSTDNIVVLTAHGMKAGDLVRLDVTANPINEFEIIVDEIVDANSFKLAGYLSASLTAGDTFFALRPVSERFDETGATLAVVASPPLSYNRKAAGVIEQTSVLEDLDTPAASKPLPVAIHSIDGAGITVNAGDLSVSTSHVNDSMALGDGTNLVGVTVANELQVHDEDVKTALATLNAKDFATQTTLATLLTDTQLRASAISVTGPLTDAQLRATPVPVSGTVSTGGLTDAELRATAVPVTANAGTNLNTSALNLEVTQALIKAKTDNLDVLLSTRNAEATQLLIQAKTDNLDVLLSTRATEATLAAQSAKLPASLGIKTAAASLSIAPASDAVFATKPKALTGVYAENLALTTVATFTAPVNAIGAIIQADDTNTASFRAKQGAVATATSGVQFQGGRSEEFKSGSDISVCSEGASVKVYVQWFIQA
jgi:hypothetical protein